MTLLPLSKNTNKQNPKQMDYQKLALEAQQLANVVSAHNKDNPLLKLAQMNLEVAANALYLKYREDNPLNPDQHVRMTPA